MILCDTFYGNVIINNCSGFWSKPTMHICSHAHRCDLSLSRARFVFSRCVCCCLSRRRCEWIALDAIVPFFCQLAAHIRGDFWNDLFPLNAVLRTGCISCNKSQTCSANTTCAASTEQELTSFREKREAKKTGQSEQIERATKLQICDGTRTAEKIWCRRSQSRRVLNRNKIVWKDSWSKHDTCEYGIRININCSLFGWKSSAFASRDFWLAQNTSKYRQRRRRRSRRRWWWWWRSYFKFSAVYMSFRVERQSNESGRRKFVDKVFLSRFVFGHRKIKRLPNSALFSLALFCFSLHVYLSNVNAQGKCVWTVTGGQGRTE